MLHCQFQATFLLAFVDRNTKQDLVPPTEFSCVAYAGWSVGDEVAHGREKDISFEYDLLRSGKFSFIDHAKKHPDIYGPALEGKDWYVDGAILSFHTLHKVPQ